MGKYFGTDGFRGQAGVELTAEHAYKIGRFLGWYYGGMQNAECRMQNDNPSGCSEGLVGADAYIRPRDDVGIVPYGRII